MSKRTMKTAGEIMHSPVGCAQHDEWLVDAARHLAKKGWSGAPVLDDAGQLVGILSEADVVQGLAAAAFYETPPPTRVRDVMSTTVQSVTPQTDLFRLVSLTADMHCKRFPVVDEGKLVGIVTRRDVMKALVASVEERWGAHSISTYDAIAKTEGIHNPFSTQ